MFCDVQKIAFDRASWKNIQRDQIESNKKLNVKNKKKRNFILIEESSGRNLSHGLQESYN